jgi:hypothetical protein
MAATEVVLSRQREAAFYEESHREVLAELRVLSRLSAVLLDMARLDETDSGMSSEENCKAKCFKG